MKAIIVVAVVTLSVVVSGIPGGAARGDATISAKGQLQPEAARDGCRPPAEIVNAIYLQVLLRPATPAEVEQHSGRIEHKEITVRELVRELARSPEYENNFIKPHTPAFAVSLLYQRLLARGTQRAEVETWTAVFSAQGPNAVINGLLDGIEYAQVFGDERVPRRPPLARPCLRAAKLEQYDMLDRGNQMTTEISFGTDGKITGVTKIVGRVRVDRFCGRVAVWLFDAQGTVIDAADPAREQTWCVAGQTAQAEERSEQWELEISADKLKAARHVAILHSFAAQNPTSLSPENIDRAKRNRKPLT